MGKKIFAVIAALVMLAACKQPISKSAYDNSIIKSLFCGMAFDMSPNEAKSANPWLEFSKRDIESPLKRYIGQTEIFGMQGELTCDFLDGKLKAVNFAFELPQGSLSTEEACVQMAESMAAEIKSGFGDPIEGYTSEFVSLKQWLSDDMLVTMYSEKFPGYINISGEWPELSGLLFESPNVPQDIE